MTLEPSSLVEHDAQEDMKLRSLDFVSVQLVVECADQGSLVAAAHQCHITAGAASRRVRILEDLLEFQIFRRTFRGLEMTEEGQSVVNACREILQGIENLSKRRSHSAQSIPYESQSVRLAA